MPSFLEELRKKKPQLSRFSDEEIIEALPRLEPSLFGGLSPEEVAFKATDDRTAVRRGIAAGVDQLQAIGGGLVGLAGDAIGSDRIKQKGLDIYESNMREASLSAPKTNFSDIDGIGSALNWAGYTIGNLAPMMATSVAGGGIGGLVGSAAAKSAAKSIIAKEVARGVTKKAAEKAAGEFIAKRVALGQALGAYTASTGMEAGSIFGETDDVGVSLVHGAIAGAFDALPVARVLNRFGAGKIAKDAVETSVIREILTQGALEGGTEGIQTLVEQHAKYWVENEGQSLLGNLPSVDWKEILEASAAGALGGGFMGGGASILKGDPVLFRKPSTDREEPDNIFKIPEAARQAGASVLQRGGSEIDAAIAEASTAIKLAPTARPFIFTPPVRPTTEGSSSIDALIASANRMNMTEEAVRLEGVKRQESYAARLRLEGRNDTADKVSERARVALESIISGRLKDVPLTVQTPPRDSLAPLAAKAPLTPATIWTGRRGDGYPTMEAASQGLATRQKIQPDLDWKIEQLPSGRFQLSGYREPIPVTPKSRLTRPDESTIPVLQKAADEGSRRQAERGDFRRTMRSAVIDRAMRSIDERGGVASPEEAQLLSEYGMGQPYDRVDETLARTMQDSSSQEIPETRPFIATNRDEPLAIPERRTVETTDLQDRLKSVPDSVFSSFPDSQVTTEGLVALGTFTPEEADALRSAGVVTIGRSEDGYNYEGVDPGVVLWPERKRRAESARKNRAGVSVKDKQNALENRASFFDQVASEKEEFYPEEAAELRQKAANFRREAASLGESASQEAPVSEQRTVETTIPERINRETVETTGESTIPETFTRTAPESTIPDIQRNEVADREIAPLERDSATVEQGPSPRDATNYEREAAQSEASYPMLDISKNRTGWIAIDHANRDGVTLVSEDGRKSIAFPSANTRSGTEAIRAHARAQSFAIDNPYSSGTGREELIIKPMYEGRLDSPASATEPERTDEADQQDLTIPSKSGTEPLIYMKSGAPFKSEKVARASYSFRSNPGSAVVPVEGGFAIQKSTPVDPQSDITPEAIPATTVPGSATYRATNDLIGGLSGAQIQAMQGGKLDGAAGVNLNEAGKSQNETIAAVDFGLTQQTADDIRKQELSRAAKESDPQDIPPPSDFVLSGSNSVVDLAEARGQKNLFDAQAASQDGGAVVPPILAMKKSTYVTRQIAKQGVRKDSPGYAAAVQRIEQEYETEVEKAEASLPFEQFNARNSDAPEAMNRAAYDMLREEYGLTAYNATESAPPSPVGDLNAAPEAPTSQDAIRDLGEKIGGARKDTSVKTGRTATKKSKDQRPAWARRYDVSQVVAGAENGKWALRDTRKKDFAGRPRLVGTFDTQEAAESAISLAAVSANHRAVPVSDGKFEIWRVISERKRVKVVDRQFASRKDALEYMAEHAAEIIETNTTFGEIDLPKPPNKERTGATRRTGDVAGKDFMETFGLRGVEFGNWNNQDERQELMNDAFDGLMDLADVLGIPPKAIGLNGDLALAFGARGHGLNSAKAHYEREKAVINLTKMNGAGSLAHEWFHALDHYFGRQDGKASSEWEREADGTRSLKAGSRGDDYVSAGFRYDSKVRQEVQDAYTSLIDTIFKKAETYVDDTQQADKFIARARDDLAKRLDDLRGYLSSTVQYKNRHNKPASAEQLAEFDTIAKQLLAGEFLETEFRTVKTGNHPSNRKGATRYTNDALEKISALLKVVRGTTGFDATNQKGWLDDIKHLMHNYSARLKMLADAQTGSEKTRNVLTSFAMNAKELDQGRGENYWTTPHEMAARAFQGFVEDKIAEGGNVSRFLNYAPENKGILTPWGVKFPYPKGDERKAINAAIAKFVDSLQVRETASGTALFSRSDKKPGKKNLPRAKSQSHAKVLNRILSKYLKNPEWENAYEAVDVSDTLSEYGKEIQTAFGRNVRFVVPTESGFNLFNGIYLPQTPDSVYVNAEAEINITAIIGHELSHALERDRPEIYKWLAENIDQYLSGIGEYTDKLNRAVQSSEEPYTIERAKKELIGDAMGDAMSDPAFLQQLADDNPSKFKGLLKAVIRYLSRMIGRLRGLNSSKYISDVEALRDKLRIALNAYAEGTSIAEAINSNPKFKSESDAIGNNGDFSESPSILASVNPTGPTFYSAALNAAKSMKQEKGPAAQMIATLKKQPGVKQEELDWIGVEEYAKGLGTVTKQQLVDFIAGNGVKVEVVGVEGVDTANVDAWWNDEGGANEEVPYSELSEEEQEEARARYADEVLQYEEGSTFKYYQYQLPGGDNYREVLLTLPSREKSTYAIRFNQTNQTIAEFPNRDAALDYYMNRMSEGDRLSAYIIHKRSDKDFRSAHFDQPNILAHVRMNDRTDADGNNVLFVEEVQSDWHQEGRKKGYGKSKVPSGWSNTNDATSGDKVPNAPFKNNGWAELAIKQILRIASEEGYDSVAWTTGEQQAGRYDLSKHIDSIDVRKIDGGKLMVYANKNNEQVITKMTRPENLDEVIGKDMAKRVLDDIDAGRPTQYRGIDLKTGGEGMKGFYDRTLPNLFKSVARKLDKSVSISEADFGDFTASSIPVTDSMRDEAMRGQPLFSRVGEQSDFQEENQKIREEDKTLWNKVKKAAKRQLAPGGLLPDSVFKAKIARDSKLGVVEFDAAHLIGEFERAIRKEYGVRANSLSDSDKRVLSEALSGAMPPNISEQSKEAVLAMRQYIDNLSAQYMGILREQVATMSRVLDDAERGLLDAFLQMRDAPKSERNKILDTAKERAKELWGDGKKMQKSLGAVATIAERISLMQTIMSNEGKYVHRSYQAFDDPKWFKKVSDEVLDNARTYLKNRLMEDGEMTEADALRRARVLVEDILKEGTAYDSMEAFIKESKLGAKDLSVLQKRKQIAPEIRALLGEYIDPRVNFAKTATKMGRLIWNQRFLDRVREVGMGQFLFTDEDRPPNTTQIATDNSEVYSPLNGLYAEREVVQAFKDALGKEQMANWYRNLVKINGAVKFGKTVLSPTTAARNWQSAMFFAIANGHFDMTQMRKSVSGLKEYFNHAGSGEKLAYLRKLKYLGVVYDTPYAGEMMRLLDDASAESLITGSRLEGGLRKSLNIAQKFYQYGDDFWKIIGFENEKNMLMKHAGMSESEAEIEAAERIRNTYPTYSMVGRGIQSLRRFPLAGTFVSFPAEIIRTSFNMLKYLHKDWQNEKTRPMAVKRAVGLAIASGFAYALQEASKAIVGFDDDDEEAVRLQVAPWQKNSNLIFTGRNEDGTLRYIDISFLDPYNYWKRPINAMLRDQPWEDEAVSAASDMLSPFFGTDILAGTIFEILANKKESGGEVFKETDSPDRKLIAIANHLRKSIQPGIASNLERTWKAIDGQVSPSGQKYNKTDEILGWVGWRVSTLDPKTALYYRSFDFNDAKSDATRTLTQVLQDSNEVSESSIARAYERTIKMRQVAYENMSKMVEASKRSGMSNAQITTTLRGANVSRDDIAALLRGVVPSWTPSKQSETSALRRAEAILGPEQAAEIRKRYQIAREQGQSTSN